MRIKMLLFLLLCNLFVAAQTIEVSGLQAGVWDADTVKVTGDVVVEDALGILPGTVVLFEGFYHISVEKDATLTANGTENDSILFTVSDTTGFYLFNSGRGGWNGIRIDRAENARFDYCRMQYGKAALDDDQDGGALRIYDCDNVAINNSVLFCNFSREHGGALNAERSKVVIRDCDIDHNLTYTGLDTVYYMYGGGLRFINCDVELVGTAFLYNNGVGAIGGALSLDSCSVNIDRCRFEHNYGINGAGLYLIRSGHLSCSISNSLFANNTSGHFGGGLAISDSSPEINNLTVVNNHSIGVNCGGIFFYQYSAPIVRNCIVYGNTNSAPLEEPVQMWTWTFDDYAPKFFNCLVQYGFDNISNNEVIHVYEDCLDTDPLFIAPDDEDFHVNNESPCVDAGSPETPQVILDGTDLDGRWRLCGSRVDIGAYEFSGEGVQELGQETGLCVVGNPVTAMSHVEWHLDNPAVVTLSIFTLDGRQVGKKALGTCPAGDHRYGIGTLFQDLADGPYLLVVSTPTRSWTGKVIQSKH